MKRLRCQVIFCVLCQADLDRSVLYNFIQLRSDFKSQKQTILKL